MQEFSMVSGYTENLEKPQNCQIGGWALARDNMILTLVYKSTFYIDKW